MKLDFKDLDRMFDDPTLDLLFGDEPKKKKKKKKGGKKDRDKANDAAYKETLKTLSKKELIAKAEGMGADLRFVDISDKKELRKTILEMRRRARASKEAVMSISPSGDVGKSTKMAGLSKSVPETVSSAPHYFDETTRQFIINDADTAPDVGIFNAMQSLGAYRTELRPDDGFGEMMRRLRQQLMTDSLPPVADTPDKNMIIDVNYTEVPETKEVSVFDEEDRDFKSEKFDKKCRELQGTSGDMDPLYNVAETLPASPGCEPKGYNPLTDKPDGEVAERTAELIGEVEHAVDVLNAAKTALEGASASKKRRTRKGSKPAVRKTTVGDVEITEF